MSAFGVPLPVDDLGALRRRTSAKWRLHTDDVLPLPVAEMDFALAPVVQEVLHDAVRRSDVGYAMPGLELGRALASFAAARWDWSVDPELVRPATDVGVACVEMLRVLCRPGDAVVINTPVYEPFFHWLDEAEANRVEVPLRRESDGGWRLDLDGLADAFARQRPVAYVLCHPHNPVGRVHSPEELAAVVGLAAEHGVTVISDEIHAPLTLPGSTFSPFLTVPGAADIGVSLHSTSKAWNLAGLKCATIVAGSPRMAALVERRPVGAGWRIGQLGSLATIAAYTDGAVSEGAVSEGAVSDGVDWLDALLATLDLRREQLAALLAERLPDISWVPPEATYLAWLDCRSIGSGDHPQRQFLERGRVAVEPGPKYGPPGDGWVRLNFGTSASILEEAVDRMASALGR